MENTEKIKKTSRSPDYDLCFLNKVTNRKGRIGAGWENEDGSISIVLDPLVVLEERDQFDIRLFVK